MVSGRQLDTVVELPPEEKSTTSENCGAEVLTEGTDETLRPPPLRSPEDVRDLLNILEWLESEEAPTVPTPPEVLRPGLQSETPMSSASLDGAVPTERAAAISAQASENDGGKMVGNVANPTVSIVNNVSYGERPSSNSITDDIVHVLKFLTSASVCGFVCGLTTYMMTAAFVAQPAAPFHDSSTAESHEEQTLGSVPGSTAPDPASWVEWAKVGLGLGPGLWAGLMHVWHLHAGK